MLLELENIVDDIKGKQQEKENLMNLFNEKVSQLKGALDARVDHIDKDIYYLTQAARAEAEQLDMKETKTQKKVSLLSGDFIIKKPTYKLNPDKEALLEKVPQEYIEVKETKSLKWADYKKNLKVMDGIVVDTVTGEIVQDVLVEEVPEQIVIK